MIFNKINLSLELHIIDGTFIVYTLRTIIAWQVHRDKKASTQEWNDPSCQEYSIAEVQLKQVA